jgi:hypothetical protein
MDIIIGAIIMFIVALLAGLFFMYYIIIPYNINNGVIAAIIYLTVGFAVVGIYHIVCDIIYLSSTR